MKRFALLLVAGLALASTGCKGRWWIKGSISGTLYIVKGEEEYKASYYQIQMEDEEGNLVGYTQSGSSGFFRFEAPGPEGNYIPLKVPWGKYVLKIYPPSMGSAGGSGPKPDPVYVKKIVIRSGAVQVQVYMDYEDVRPGRR